MTHVLNRLDISSTSDLTSIKGEPRKGMRIIGPTVLGLKTFLTRFANRVNYFSTTFSFANMEQTAGGRKDLTTLTICGGGNGSHAWAGIASSQPNTNVRVLTLHKGGAGEWNEAMKTQDFVVTLTRKDQEPLILTTKPDLVTEKPEDAIPGSNVIALVTPAFSHEKYLHAIKPYVQPGTTLVGLPGQCGFEYQVDQIMGDLAKECTIMNFESLPWACRTAKFGVSCNVLGTKDALLGAMRLGKTPPKRDPITILQYLLGEKPVLNIAGDLLGVSLMSTNAYIHPSIIYGQWSSWDAISVSKAPLSYHGISQDTADLLSGISSEILKTAQVTTIRLCPHIDLSQVEPIYNWYIRCYSADIEDNTSLKTCLTTNEAFRGLYHPMTAVAGGKLNPNFNHRYLTEDVPYGLLVIRGVAELAGVDTPNMDKVIIWAQEKLGKSFLVDGKVQGCDINETRAPQRFGFSSLKDIL